MSWYSQQLTHSNGTTIPIHAVQVFDHAMIHQGLGFTHSAVYTVGAAANLDLLLATGEHSIHVRALKVASTGAPLESAYYLSPTTSAAGTPVSVGNNNLTSSKVTECTLTSSPTVTAVGTRLGGDIFPSYGGGQAGSSGTLAGGEWVLPANTDILIRVTNNDNASIDLSFNFFWYEPHNRT